VKFPTLVSSRIVLSCW